MKQMTRGKHWMMVMIGLAVIGWVVGGATADAQRQGWGRAAGQPPSAEAPQAEGGAWPEPGWRIERFMDRLDLSDAQREQLTALRETGRERNRDLRKQLRLAKHELEGELLKDAPSLTEVRELARRVGEVRTEMRIQRLEQRLALRDLLTEDQRERLNSLRRHHRRGMTRGGPHGHAPCAPGCPSESGHHGHCGHHGGR